MTTGPPAERDSARTFRPDVEGLRAVAIILVVVYHAFTGWCPGGYVGVDVFFVISGYLITRQLVGEMERSGRLSFLAFYARRARRILPAAMLVAALVVVASKWILPPLAAKGVTTDALSAAVFGLNYRLAIQGSNYLTAGAATSPLQHYWSLAIEEQFYLLWPALLLGASRLWRRRSTGAVALTLGIVASGCFALSLWMTTTSPTWAYYSLWTRGWELAAGGIVAVSLPRLQRLNRSVALPLGWGGLVAIILAGELFGSSTTFPGTAALVPTLGAVAVIAASSPEGRSGPTVEWLLARRPLQAIGRLSYSIYLWHFPLLVLAAAELGHALPPLSRLLVVALSVVAAAVTYRFVEQPIRRVGGLVKAPMRGLGLGFGCALVAAIAALLVSTSLPSLAGPGRRAQLTATSGTLTAAAIRADLAAGLQIRAVPSNLTPSIANAPGDVPIVYRDGCHVAFSGTTSPPCIFGDVTGRETVVLFGDSHAAQWFPALQEISRQQHWRLISLTKSGCPAAYVTVSRFPGTTPYPECNTWRDYALQRISQLRPSVVITSSDLSFAKLATAIPGTPRGHGGIWLNGMAKTLTALKAAARHVVLVTDTPTFPDGVPSCLSAHLTDQRPCTGVRSKVVVSPELSQDESSLTVAEGGAIVRSTPLTCARLACPVIVGNVLMYRDADHLVPQYTRLVAPVLRGSLLAAIS